MNDFFNLLKSVFVIWIIAMPIVIFFGVRADAEQTRTAHDIIVAVMLFILAPLRWLFGLDG